MNRHIKSLLIKVSLFAVTFFSVAPAFGQKLGQDFIDSIKNDIRTIKNPDTTQIKNLFRVANAYLRIDLDSAENYAKKGLAFAEKIKWNKAIAALNDCLGNIELNKGNFDRAIGFYKKSMAINQLIHNELNLAGNLINIGAAHQRQGNFVQSLDYNYEALKIADRRKFHEYIALVNINISNIYFDQHNYKKALEHTQKAYNDYQLRNDLHGLALASESFGSIFLAQKNFKQAAIYLNKALKLQEQTGNELGKANILSKTALLYENDKAKKLGYLIKAQQIFDRLAPNYTISITNLGNIAGTYNELFAEHRLERYNDQLIPKTYNEISNLAIRYYQRSLNASKIVGDKDNRSYFAEELSALYARQGDFKAAYNNLKLSNELSDSLYSQESKNKIASLQAAYAFQKKEDGYKARENLNKLKLKQTYLIGALILVIVMAGAIIFFSRIRIKQLRLKNELQRQRAEAETKELIHRNKLSESELKAIRSQMNPHFIFNVLNSIESYIVENDARTASKLVQKFASLSRLILENSTQSLVPADREWKALQLYTALEAMRFNHKFSYEFVTDELLDLSTIMIPPMLVQPLIENAIHHGIAPSGKNKNAIKVSIHQTQNSIVFSVDDDGAGYTENFKQRRISQIKTKSIGLSSIRERLENFNAIHPEGEAAFNIRRKDEEAGGGTLAEITLPIIYRR